jgi:hypothetical protein
MNKVMIAAPDAATILPPKAEIFLCDALASSVLGAFSGIREPRDAHRPTMSSATF